MKKIILSVIFILMLSGAFAQNDLGVGIVVGEPTGLSGELWTSQTTALDGAVAWSFLNGGSFYLHADFLNHYFNVISIQSGKMPLYWGFGAKAVLADDPVLGAQTPLGISYLFEDAPLEIFLEIRPGLNVVPSTAFDMSGGIGVRFYLQQ